MTKGGRIAGGVLSIIGGGLAFLTALLFFMNVDPSEWVVPVIFGASGVLGVLGGILLLVDKRIGGILVIIGGVATLVYFIYLAIINPLILIFGIFAILFLLPTGLMLAGGIVGTATSGEPKESSEIED